MIVRRLGRTTRTLADATALAEQGERVIVLTHSRWYADYLKATHPKLEFLPVARAHERLRGLRAHVFIDHAAYEHAFWETWKLETSGIIEHVKPR